MPMPTPPQNPVSTVTLSMVSHGHGNVLPALLSDIQSSIDVPYRLILTLNIPEDEAFLGNFSQMPITVIRNPKPLGFGQNHNQAFSLCTDPVFVIVNPDIRATPFTLLPLLAALTDNQVGASGPMIVSGLGVLQDSARRFPTVRSLLARKLRMATLDYPHSATNRTVDWLAGMLVAFNSPAYQAIGGFDEAYFMYVEDVDIGWRLGKAGYRSVWVPDCQFTHDAQHGSRKQWRHLLWHVQSMLRFLRKASQTT